MYSARTSDVAAESRLDVATCTLPAADSALDGPAVSACSAAALHATVSTNAKIKRRVTAIESD
jgi:hypothetical protein